MSRYVWRKNVHVELEGKAEVRINRHVEMWRRGGGGDGVEVELEF